MIINFLNAKRDLVLFAAALVIMVVSLTFRLINISYNVPFNDEAIYIIVGLMGIFERDWWTYNAAVWIPGVQYIYPSLTGIAYSVGGIEASRFVNVLLSVFLVEIIFLLTLTIYSQVSSKSKKINLPTILAGTIAALLISGAETSFYVSRLATYDMPSFTLLFLSLYLLVHTKPLTSGRRYFYASLTLVLSFMTKIITGIYLPLIMVYFYWYARKLSKLDLDFYKKYFLLPVIFVLIIFTLITFEGLSLYYSSQKQLEKAELSQIFQMIWGYSKYAWGFWLVGTVGFLIKRQFLLWGTLTFSALWIVLFHIYSLRTLSMDKHLFLMLAFLAIASGIGIANLFSGIKYKFIQIPLVVLVFGALVGFWIAGYQNSLKFNNQWQNTSPVEQELVRQVRSGDKVLAESGSTIILATYYKNYPPNTTTFDWLEYRNKTGEDAFRSAVRDGYFDFIQLQSDTHSKSERNAYLSKLIKENMGSNYKLVFDQDGLLLYRRTF